MSKPNQYDALPADIAARLASSISGARVGSEVVINGEDYTILAITTTKKEYTVLLASKGYVYRVSNLWGNGSELRGKTEEATYYVTQTGKAYRIRAGVADARQINL